MKITKRQLRRIIREERQRLVELEEYRPPLDAEGNNPNTAEISKLMLVLRNAVDALWNIMEPEELAVQLEGMAEEMREMYAGAEEW